MPVTTFAAPPAVLFCRHCGYRIHLGDNGRFVHTITDFTVCPQVDLIESERESA